MKVKEFDDWVRAWVLTPAPVASEVVRLRNCADNFVVVEVMISKGEVCVNTCSCKGCSAAAGVEKRDECVMVAAAVERVKRDELVVQDHASVLTDVIILRDMVLPGQEHQCGGRPVSSGVYAVWDATSESFGILSIRFDGGASVWQCHGCSNAGIARKKLSFKCCHINVAELQLANALQLVRGQRVLPLGRIGSDSTP